MNRSEYFARDFSKVALPRTRRLMPFQHLTAFNTGDIIPLMAEEIYPGDEWKTKVAALVRMYTPLKQIFSNIYFDLHAFFVPNRLVWTHWVNFCGQNDTTAWTETGIYTVPTNSWYGADISEQDYEDEFSFKYCGTLADYFGINPDVASTSDTDAEFEVSDLFRRGYLLIYNEWYRDENIIAPILFSKGDQPEDSQVVSYSSVPLKAAKFHDVFTTLLPEPQKGNPPEIGGDYPVVAGDEHLKNGDDASHVSFRNIASSKATGSATNILLRTTGDGYLNSSGLLDGITGGGLVTPTNLWAKVALTIEDIRQAAVATHVLEKLASSGSRYPEFLQSIWSVTAANAELQIPELLGVQRFPINIQEVISNADTAGESSGELLGATGAMSKTGIGGHLFNKAFTEYGILYIMGVIRIEQDYFQGNHPKFKRTGFFSYFNPLLEGIGNQPQPKSWLKSTATGVLGYSEPWPELEHIPYLVTSIMRPDGPLSLSHWTAAEIYEGTPALNKAFIEQPATGLDRCIAVPSTTRGSFQWFGQFKFLNEVTRIKSPHPQPGVTRI